MRKYPFHEYINNPDSLSSVNMPVVDESFNGVYPKSVIPYAEFINKGFVQSPPLQKNMLYKVEYTDNESKLIPHLLSCSNDMTTINIGNLGKYKNTHWEFQQEWRYIFVAFPIDVRQITPSNDRYITLINQKLVEGNLLHPFSFYDLRIEDDAFNEMEIMLGPRISKGNEIIVRTLAEKYNSSAKIEQSKLVGKI